MADQRREPLLDDERSASPPTRPNEYYPPRSHSQSSSLESGSSHRSANPSQLAARHSSSSLSRHSSSRTPLEIDEIHDTERIDGPLDPSNPSEPPDALYKPALAHAAFYPPATPVMYYPSSTTEINNNINNDDFILSKSQTYQGWQGHARRICALVTSSSIAYAIAFSIMISGLAYGVIQQAQWWEKPIDWEQTLRVAFIGNSYFFVNDVPRLFQALSAGQVPQAESCLHSGVSLGALLYTGNGMYPRWQTEEAMSEIYLQEYGGDLNIYDYGLCTVAQTLQGYDKNITYKNQYTSTYYDDGKNPCITVPYYLDYLQDYYLADSDAVNYDFVFLADQTKRMAVQQGRNFTVQALTNIYGPLIKENGATPVLVDTHAFWSSNANMTGLEDIPTFQALIEQGVQEYASALSSVLPSRQSPRVAPIGIAYLVIWEERNELWESLFLEDSVHASPRGSYLLGLVLYSTIFGHLPKEETLYYQPEYFFVDSRRLIGNDLEFPSYDEVVYMRNVVERVALESYVPTSLKEARANLSR